MPELHVGDHPGAVTMVTINQMNVICLGMGTGLQQLDYLPLEHLVGAIFNNFYYVIGAIYILLSSGKHSDRDRLHPSSLDPQWYPAG